MDSPMDADASASAHDACVENVAGIAAFELDADDRRREIASHLERYRARRKPRPPRYPSLRLPFDSSDKWTAVSGSALARSAEIPTELASHNTRDQNAPQLVESRTPVIEEQELFANVIEFPRSAAVPVYQPNELAEPIFERPRIVEAPEILPPPPALGGMLLEPARDRETDRRASADVILASASLPRRMLAGLLDALVMAAGLAGFGA